MIIGQLALEIVALLWALRSRARVLAVVLAYALVDELVVAALQGLVLAGAPKPFTGWARVGYHLETAIVLGWPAVLAGASWRLVIKSDGGYKIRPRLCFAPKFWVARFGALFSGLHFRSSVDKTPSRLTFSSFYSNLVAFAWALAVVVLALAFPLPRGWTAPTLHAIEGLFVVLAVLALGVGFRRRRLGSFESWALAALVAVELVVATCGAWGNDVFTDWETLARIPHSAGLIVAIGFLAYEARR